MLPGDPDKKRRYGEFLSPIFTVSYYIHIESPGMKTKI